MADVDADQLPIVEEAQQQARESAPNLAPEAEPNESEAVTEAHSEEPAHELQNASDVSMAQDQAPEFDRSPQRPFDRFFALCFGAVVDVYRKLYDAAYERLFGEKSPDRDDHSELRHRPGDSGGPSMGF